MRYLAPLNYNRFFKKVFSDLDIAKAFLENFFNVKIESIELLPLAHKITDASVEVEFDYRCKIDGEYYIIEMQQWHKSDVVKRFFSYFSLNNVLQLENMTRKDIDLTDKKTQKTLSYDELVPSITLVWMVDELLKFDEDYVAYAVLPEQSVDFIRNDALWQRANWRNLKKERQRVLKIVENKAKGIDFLAKNRLIFAFQKNIIKNTKHRNYLKWFEFAEKTRNPDNTKEDFAVYEKDAAIMSVINRLRTDILGFPEVQHIEDHDEYLRLVSRHRGELRREFEEEFEEKYEKRTERKMKRIAKEVTKEVTAEVTKEVTAEVTKEVTKEVTFNVIKNLCLNSDFSDETIAALSGVDLSFVKWVRSTLNES